MIKIENFNKVISSGLFYGGHSGSKEGIILNNERWFLKYPKSTKNMEVVGISYTTSPISEYLGSNIYKLLGLDVHETKLGIRDNKLVVACKDFLNTNEVIVDYNSLKNNYDFKIEKQLEELSYSSRHETDLDEVEIVLENNEYLKKCLDLKTRFWDMFIVDAFIANNDRNENNWGLVLNRDSMDLRVSKVFDNGASFYSKTSDEKIKQLLENEFKLKQVIYDSSISVFSKNDKKINPLKFIENMNNKDCNEAMLRIYPKIDLNKIKELFDSIPEIYNGIQVLSKSQKDLYYKSLEYKYINVFTPVYKKLKENN